MLQVACIGLGPIGRRVAADVERLGVGRVVAAVDVDPELAGEELSALVPEIGAEPGAPGVRVRADPEAIDDVALDAAVVATSSSLPRCAPTLRALLSRGLAVTSSCEELAWPWLRHAALATELDELAKSHGARASSERG